MVSDNNDLVDTVQHLDNWLSDYYDDCDMIRDNLRHEDEAFQDYLIQLDEERPEEIAVFVPHDNRAHDRDEYIRTHTEIDPNEDE